MKKHRKRKPVVAGRNEVRARGPLPLVGMIEIAQRAGVRRSTVSDWKRRHLDFPDAVALLTVGPVFWWPDVQRWLADTGRRFDQNRQDLLPPAALEARAGKLKAAFRPHS